MQLTKSILAVSVSAALLVSVGCSSSNSTEPAAEDDTTNTPPATTGNVGNDTFAMLGLPMVSEWFANSGAGNDSTTTVDLTSSGKPQNAFATTVTGKDFTPTSGQTTAGFVATTYAGAFDPTAATQWTEGWTVGLHGNDNVWTPATGLTPVADGTCPTGTTLNATESSLVVDAIGNSMDVCDLAARYSADNSTITLTNDNIYRLSSGFPGTIIGNGDANDGDITNDVSVSLVIEAGTLVLANTQEALIISRGSSVAVNGTQADPVVMTSYNSRPLPGVTATNGRGEWAGFALMGYAPTNECGTPCDVQAEGNIGSYGGTDNTDSSGSVKYLVVKHAGNDLDGNGNELNGFTLFGVGSGTSIDFVQVHKGLDDGIEHFGSSDFMSHIVLTDNADDGFDWGQGYTGGAQFIVAKQANDDGDRGIEADNDKNDPTAVPISQPTLANMTLMAADNSAETSADGILLRRGTGANIYNSIVAGFADACIDIDEEATMDAAHDGTDVTTGYTGKLTIENSFVDCAVDFEEGDQNLDGI